MKSVSVTFEVANYADVQRAKHGLLAPNLIRRATVEGGINLKVMRMVLPKAVVDALGLPAAGQTIVRCAGRDDEKRDMVNNAFVQLLGRGSVFNAIVEPNRTDALIGAIVMEDLDLIVDCGKNEVVPRDPNGIISEVE